MVTMLDIAKHCGVSVTTVSRVLSNIDYPVSEKSRECVLKSADQLGYQMNYLGRFLKNNHTNDIGVIIPDITNDFYARLVSGIQDSLLNSENNFLLSVSYRNVEYEKQLLNNMLQRRVRGIILASVSSSGSFFKKINTDGIPIVSVGNLFGLGCHEIDYCYYESGEMVAKYLLDMGHTRVAVMNMRSGAKSR
ncbi:MAG: LacI family DNA-binding transcriptional regulator, partial [Oscillospiraceae bacterium]